MSEPNDPNETHEEPTLPSAIEDETEHEAQEPQQPLPELSDDAIRDLLARCQQNPTDENSLVVLIELRDYLVAPALAKNVIETAVAVTAPVLAEPNPSPVVQAHMMILLSFLIDMQRERDAVDQLFAAWLRHPSSYGPGRGTPPAFQKAEFVQRLADLLGWGTIDVQKDREAIGRFLEWIDSWTVKNRFKVRRTLDVMRRNFGSPELWRRVHFPKG